MRTPMLALTLLAGWQAALSAERKAVPVERPPFQAEVASIDHDWNIVFATEVQRQSLPAAELVCWGTPGEFLRGPVIVLADGGLLAAEVTGIDKLNLNADSLLLGSLTVPLDRVAGIVFQLPADLRRQTLLFDRIAGREKGSGAFSRNGPEGASQKRLLTPFPGRLTDRIVLENGDELAGLLDRLDTDRVRLRTEAGPIEVDRRTVAAVLFNPALTRRALPDGLHAWVGLSDGSLIPATRIALDQQKFAISTLATETWAALPEDLVFLQPVGGRAVYLSAIEPEDYRHEPYLELLWPWRRDRSVTGGRLRCGGRMYLTGLGMHTATRLTYRLDGSYQRFQADVGVDDSTGGRGSVQFRVLVDGQERFASGPVRGGEPPETVDVDLAGAARLELVADFAERAHVLDHANWLDARLVEPRDR
ncbi:MAG: NPCBM/NEW2 domain-containing protein [Thermoguttaceae bacterium]|nr:NPCBM/NEW2 domain-containing protein [Thermoguttaceae bacterium]